MSHTHTALLKTASHGNRLCGKQLQELREFNTCKLLSLTTPPLAGHTPWLTTAGLPVQVWKRSKGSPECVRTPAGERGHWSHTPTAREEWEWDSHSGTNDNSLASQPYFSVYAHACAKVGGGGKEKYLSPSPSPSLPLSLPSLPLSVSPSFSFPLSLFPSLPLPLSLCKSRRG